VKHLSRAGTSEALLIAELSAAGAFPPDLLSTQDSDYRRPGGN
jgi:hypothetical protein